MKPIMNFVVIATLILSFIGTLIAQEQQAISTEKTSIETVPLEIKVEDKTVDPFSYCILEMNGSYNQHDIAFDSLYTEAGKQSVDLNQTPFGVYYNNPAATAEADLAWAVGLRVDKSLEINEPLVKKEWNFTRVASVTYEGEFGNDDYNRMYEKLYQYVYENGCEPAGPMFEQFLSIPETYPSGALGGKIEIWLPIQKMKIKEQTKPDQQTDRARVTKPEVKVDAKKDVEQKQQ
ncbi:GyrI-like domain-containing protein [candidate division KSB1 bacterium]|nr:GyrI-like domain-containing protein [candidate division KSB1 bacterium]